jgi:glyoxylase-like metal-dependent hydrolase (beta-lactamase superfamily II)
MLNIRHFFFNPFQERSYIIWDGSLKGAVIDPGFMEEEEGREFFSTVRTLGLDIQCILLTHAHIDHIYGVAACLREFPGIKVYMSPEERFVKDHADLMAQMMRMPNPDTSWDTVDLFDGQIVEFGETRLEVISTPGHSPGSVCFHCPASGDLFSGDTLFAGSIGRSDLPGGDYDKEIASITVKLIGLDSDTSVHPGHGWDTTIGEERVRNPFLSNG